MPKHVSLYDAKSRLSALVREVREGRSVIITVHGVPAAELRPIAADQEPTLEERLAALSAQGIIAPALMNPTDPAAFPTGPRKSGALARFLAERE